MLHVADVDVEVGERTPASSGALSEVLPDVQRMHEEKVPSTMPAGLGPINTTGLRFWFGCEGRVVWERGSEGLGCRVKPGDRLKGELCTNEPSKTPPKFHEKNPREGRKKENCGGRWRKRAKFCTFAEEGGPGWGPEGWGPEGCSPPLPLPLGFRSSGFTGLVCWGEKILPEHLKN